jgi:hypothetical protein
MMIIEHTIRGDLDKGDGVLDSPTGEGVPNKASMIKSIE